MSQLYKSFRAKILRDNLIEPGDSVLAGASGGVDSMVLATLLLELQKDLEFNLSLAHVNYGLRGKESDAQEKLVSDFAQANQLRCFVARPKLSLAEDDNLQSAARDFRYHYFSEVALEVGANRVAVGHHKEDQVETILGHLLRGSSLKGLAGMRLWREMQTPKSKILLIRPLLTFSKEDIKSYAAANAISYLEDSSNASKEYWRNELRHDLLPLLEKLRPKAFDKIVQLGDEMRELSDFVVEAAQTWLQEFAKKEENFFWISKPRFEKLPKRLRLEVLHQAVLSFAVGLKNLKRDHLTRCEQIALRDKTEGTYHLPEEVRFMRQGDSLLLVRGYVSLETNNETET